MGPFRVALSPDIRHKGKAVFDLSPLTSNPDIEIAFVEPENGIMPASVVEYDAADPAVSFAPASLPTIGSA
jgi:hypothetical protein